MRIGRLREAPTPLPVRRDESRPHRDMLPRLRHALLLASLLAPAAAACGRLEARAAQVVFHDDFNGENGMVSRADYRGFRQWEVAAGSVDLIGTYPFDPLPPGRGMYVDLDGCTNHGATLRTRHALALAPGEYVLSFRLGGSQRISDPNTVHVSLGTVYRESFSMTNYAPVRKYVRRIAIAKPVAARIELVQDGGDNFGLLLDDVELVRLATAPDG
jgi:hypothetical protein